MSYPQADDTSGRSSSSLGHVPTGAWSFDQSVTDVFADMIARSIPQYEVMRRAVFDVGARFVVEKTHVVDLGSSLGDALAAFVDYFGARNKYVGVELAEPMLKASRERFQEPIKSDIVAIERLDLRYEYPRVEASLTLCILTLQFVPIEHRQRLLRRAYLSTVPDGAFVIVEKVLGASAPINDLMIDLYHTRKREAGYSDEEVERKRLSLEGVLVPVTARWNEQLLLDAGFRQVDCFWRWMNFAGWVATK